MTDFELEEHRGWALYGQNPYTGDWSMETHFGALHVQTEEGAAHYLARESQRVEEVTIRPVCLGADPVQFAAVQMAIWLVDLLQELRRRHVRGIDDEHSPFWLWRYGSHQTFGGSLEREP